MKTKYAFALVMAAVAAGGFGVHAQDSDKPKFSFKPAGRVLFDGALFAPTHDTFSDGVAIPDIRLGGKATYGKFAAKIDVGYGNNKLGLKDVFLQYTPDEHNLIRLGYFVHQFGLNAATSSSMKPSMLAPTSDDFFNATGRNLGINYVYDKDDWFVGVSAIASATSLSTPANQQGKISVGGLGRFVWRPLHSTGSVVQIGVSPWYQGAEHKRIAEGPDKGKVAPGYFNYKAGFPTKVDNVNLIGVDVDNARGVFKVTPELLLSAGPVALESQYYYMNINRRHNFSSYSAQGAYGLFRCLLLGDKQYGYSHADAGLATPSPKTLECVVGYNYTNARDSHSHINGGITNDASVTFNYYINKYMIARLRYSYTNCFGSANPENNRHVNIIQARIMFKF